MYRIGYIDDDNEMIGDYIKRLRRYEIELLSAPEGDMPMIKSWIVEQKIKCMLVDYQLKTKYDFFGTDLIYYLNDKLPGLPCIILTSYPDSSISENLVMQNLIQDRSVMDSNFEEFEAFCKVLIQATEVFDKKMKLNGEKYECLLEKREKEKLSAEEEEEFLKLFQTLREHGEIDDIPSQLMSSHVNERIDTVLVKLDELLKR